MNVGPLNTGPIDPSTGASLMYGDGVGVRLSISTNLVQAHDGTWVTPDHLCPDLLRWENIGAADGLRGRAVRAFFWLLRAWPSA